MVGGAEADEAHLVAMVCEALPAHITACVPDAIASAEADGGTLGAICIDVGSSVVLRFVGGSTPWTRVSHDVLEASDVAAVEEALVAGASEDGGREGSWTSDNRMGMSGTLHRISRSKIDGWTTVLTLRIGHHGCKVAPDPEREHRCPSVNLAP